MPKQISRKGIVKKLDDVVSDIVVLRDKRCVVCGSTSKLGNGHVFSRKAYNTRWDIRKDGNCHCQCLSANSNIRMFNGSYKNIKKIKVGDFIWGFDEDTFEIVKSQVEIINSFMPKELYEIVMENGKKFYATPDHKVVANGKWVEIKDILHNVLAYDIMSL